MKPMQIFLNVMVTLIACCIVWSILKAGIVVSPQPIHPEPIIKVDTQQMHQITPQKFEQLHVPKHTNSVNVAPHISV